MNRRELLAALCCAGLIGMQYTLLGSAHAQPPMPWVKDELWKDAARQREVPVRIRVPAQPGPWPVIIYSHGLGGNLEAGTLWGEAWSAAGFVVLHLQHQGSDTAAVRRDFRAAMAPEQLLARTQDVTFVLNEIARLNAALDAIWVDADLSRIGMAGHSFGALTTLALAGQRFATGLQHSEPRLKAFMAFSPSGGGRVASAGTPGQERFGALRGPCLFITGTLDGDVVGSGETPEGRTIPYSAAPVGEKYLWVLKDADHMSFGGQPLRRRLERTLRRTDAARDSDAAHQQQIIAISTRYWNAMLKDHAAALKALDKPSELAAGDRWEHK